MTTRIAYFINAYPAVSHSFIRREIHGLEGQGFAVERVALRGWAGELVDDVDYDFASQRVLVPIAVVEASRGCVIGKPRAVFLSVVVGHSYGLAWGSTAALPFWLFCRGLRCAGEAEAGRRKPCSRPLRH